jgi:hypothetical protein
MKSLYGLIVHNLDLPFLGVFTESHSYIRALTEGGLIARVLSHYRPNSRISADCLGYTACLDDKLTTLTGSGVGPYPQAADLDRLTS